MRASSSSESVESSSEDEGVIGWGTMVGGGRWCLGAWTVMVDDDVPFLCRIELLPRELSRARTPIGLGRAFDNASRLATEGRST